MERQISKFNRLLQNGPKKQEQGGHSNHQDDCIDQGPHMDGVKKWVINLSSIPLTKEQESLLVHGPNFAITPKKPPLGEYISNIEKACQSLDTMDRSDYIKKAKELLEDTNTYRTIQSDPTSRLRNKLVKVLRKIKAETGMQEIIYRKMYPTGVSPPKFYGLPKIHEKEHPPKAHSIQHWFSFIWSGQRIS